jgi:hypothetical protein
LAPPKIGYMIFRVNLVDEGEDPRERAVDLKNA